MSEPMSDERLADIAATFRAVRIVWERNEAFTPGWGEFYMAEELLAEVQRIRQASESVVVTAERD